MHKMFKFLSLVITLFIYSCFPISEIPEDVEPPRQGKLIYAEKAVITYRSNPNYDLQASIHAEDEFYVSVDPLNQSNWVDFTTPYFDWQEVIPYRWDNTVYYTINTIDEGENKWTYQPSYLDFWQSDNNNYAGTYRCSLSVTFQDLDLFNPPNDYSAESGSGTKYFKGKSAF